MVTVNFIEYGSFLATRTQAKEIAVDLQSLMKENPVVVFNLAGVQSVSLSFSDEIFFNLIQSFGFETFKSKTHFINANDAVSAVLSRAIGLNRVQA